MHQQTVVIIDEARLVGADDLRQLLRPPQPRVRRRCWSVLPTKLAPVKARGGMSAHLSLICRNSSFRKLDVVTSHNHSHVLGQVDFGGAAQARAAVDVSLKSARWWGSLPWEERVAPFLRAADMLQYGPWRAKLNAATMLELSKTTYQADIDAACETVDFIRANVKNMLDMYDVQPGSTPGAWNRLEYRPLEGFVFAVTPFNFTCMNNLAFAPAILGNTVVWKPAESASLVAHLSMQLLKEAGLPDGVINVVYGDGAAIGPTVLESPHLAAVHFTGSTGTFQHLWRTVGENVDPLPQLPAGGRRDRRQGLHPRPPERGCGSAGGGLHPRCLRVPGAEVLSGLTAVCAAQRRPRCSTPGHGPRWAAVTARRRELRWRSTLIRWRRGSPECSPRWMTCCSTSGSRTRIISRLRVGRAGAGSQRICSSRFLSSFCCARVRRSRRLPKASDRSARPSLVD